MNRSLMHLRTGPLACGQSEEVDPCTHYRESVATGTHPRACYLVLFQIGQQGNRKKATKESKCIPPDQNKNKCNKNKRDINQQTTTKT